MIIFADGTFSQPLYSLIAFAQDDGPKEDGFLHIYEVFNLRLNADLVTLSACLPGQGETGGGKLCRGEELIGLTRDFMYAGAPSVVVSLWSVDESTAALIKVFYQNLKEVMSKAEALQRAKLKLIRTREGGMSFAHPFLWVAFVLVGEVRPYQAGTDPSAWSAMATAFATGSARPASATGFAMVISGYKTNRYRKIG